MERLVALEVVLPARLPAPLEADRLVEAVLPALAATVAARAEDCSVPSGERRQRKASA